jgi:alanine racemase
MTHLACADDPDHLSNQRQIAKFNDLAFPDLNIVRSIANSAAILSLPETYADVVRPGLLIYGASPFPEKIGVELGLKPVMCFVSKISAIHDYPAHVKIGYGGSWESLRPSKIGIVPVGYGDGYPRHIAENTPVWVNDLFVPIVGRVSMDMMTIDLTDCPSVNIGDSVELWGRHVAVETVAKSAGTIAYELLCQVSPRARLMAG